MTGTPTWFDAARRHLGELVGALWVEMRERGVTPYLEPVGPYSRGLAGPLVAAAGIVGLVLLSGIAVTGMSIALLALVALWMLLRDVFGFSFELAPFVSARP